MNNAVPSPFRTGEVMTPRELAKRDQEEAREREFERKARPFLIGFLVVVALLGAWAYLMVAGVVPAMPWSPLGKAG